MAKAFDAQRLALFAFLNFTVTVPDVVLPAFGLEEENFPLPRILYLQSARLSFLRAFFTVRPRSFGTLHFFFVEVAGGAGGGGGGGTKGGAARDAADLVADDAP